MQFHKLALIQLFSLAQAQWFSNRDRCKTPDGQYGRCLRVNFCQPMLDALDFLPLTPELKAYLQSFRCGYEGRQTKVCCPPGPIYFTQDPIDAPPDVSRHTNLRLLPRECGHLDDDDDRIVNGNKTGLFEFPWMALLAYNTNSGPSFRCGGTIINDRYILTAAHCVSHLQFDLIAARVGEHDTRTQVDCESSLYYFDEVCAPPYQDLGIEKIIPHPGYDKNAMVNDIALVKVTPIDLSFENSRPVCLPLAEARTYNFTKRNVVVTGWGYTENGRPSPELLKVELPAIGLRQCQDLYEGIVSLDRRHLCAGGRSNSDSCSGDSGGPLHAKGSLHGQLKWIQQGVVSFGPKDCGKTPLPGVYTRVAYYMDWILDTLRP